MNMMAQFFRSNTVTARGQSPAPLFLFMHPLIDPSIIHERDHILDPRCMSVPTHMHGSVMDTSPLFLLLEAVALQMSN